MRVIILFFGCLLISTLTFADIIYLTNGASISGEVVSQTDDKVEVNISGINITYYRDEIDRIEADPSEDETVELEKKSEQKIEPTKISERPKPSSKDNDKQELIVRFMDAFGTTDVMSRSFHQTLARMSPQEAGKVKKVVTVSRIMEQLIPVYDKNFTEQELKYYIKFYESKHGRKLVETLPALMRESVEVSLEYLQNSFPDKEW